MTAASRAQRSSKPIIPRLRRELGERLEALEREAHAIRRALTALDEQMQSKATPTSTTGLDAGALLAAVTREPGVRASSLALLHGLEPGFVSGMLAELEGQGLIRRDGLGWIVCSNRSVTAS